MKYLLRAGLIAGLLSQTFSYAAANEHDYFDGETTKITPQFLISLHEVNLVYPRNAEDIDKVLQETVYKSNPDFYKNGGIVKDWRLSYKEAFDFLNNEYKRYKIIQPEIAPTHELFTQCSRDLVVFMGNKTTAIKNAHSMNLALSLGYGGFNRAHFLFFKGDEINLEGLLEQYPALHGENGLFQSYDIQVTAEKVNIQQINLKSLQESGHLAANYMVVSPTLFFKRQSDLASEILTAQNLGGFSVPCLDWLSELTNYGYIKSFEEIYNEYKENDTLIEFKTKYLGNNAEEITDSGEIIKRAATIAWARSHVNMQYARAVHQAYLKLL